MKVLLSASLAVVMLNASAATPSAQTQEVRSVDVAVSGPMHGLLYVVLYNKGEEDIEIGPLEYGEPGDLIITGLTRKRPPGILIQPDGESVRRWGISRTLFGKQFIGRSIEVSKLGIPSGKCLALSFAYRYSAENYVVSSRNIAKKTICINASEP